MNFGSCGGMTAVHVTSTAVCHLIDFVPISHFQIRNKGGFASFCATKRTQLKQLEKEKEGFIGVPIHKTNCCSCFHDSQELNQVT